MVAIFFIDNLELQNYPPLNFYEVSRRRANTMLKDLTPSNLIIQGNNNSRPLGVSYLLYL